MGRLRARDGSGAGCGAHWPLCNGEVIPRAPTVATLIEYSHRLTSGLALLAVVALLVWTWRACGAGHPARRGAVLSLLFILTEAAVGAGLVLFELVADNATMARAMFMAAHLVNTFLLVAALTLTAWWLSGGDAVRPGRRPAIALAWGALAVGLLLSGVSGAVAALGDTLYPAASHAEGLTATLSPSSHVLLRLRALHPVIAVSAGVLLMFGASRLPAAGDDGGPAAWPRGVDAGRPSVARRAAQPASAGAGMDADRAPARRRPVVDRLCPAGRAGACRGTRSRSGPYHHAVNMHRHIVGRGICQALLVSRVVGANFSSVAAIRAAPPVRPPHLPPSQPVLAPAAEIAQKAEAYLRAQERVNGFSGAVLVARDGVPVVSKGYGWANAEWEIPNTPTTKFRLGSITKQFTATWCSRCRNRRS